MCRTEDLTRNRAFGLRVVRAGCRAGIAVPASHDAGGTGKAAGPGLGPAPFRTGPAQGRGGYALWLCRGATLLQERLAAGVIGPREAEMMLGDDGPEHLDGAAVRRGH